MANRQTQDEIEYQDSLRITQSMLGDISRAMADTADSTDGRNRALSQQLDITRDILNSVSDVRDYDRTINQLLTQQTQINSTNYGINERLRQVQLAQLDATLAILRAGEDTEKVFRRVNDVASETATTFNSGIDSILTKLEDIPIVGKSLKNLFQPLADKSKRIINVTTQKFTKGFTTAFAGARAGGASFTNSLGAGLSGGVKGMSSMIGMAGKLLASINPIVLAIIAIGLAAYAGFERFKEIDSAAKSFREETGLLNSQTQTLKSNIQAVSNEFAGLGVSAEDVGKSATAFTTVFGGLEQPSKEVLGSMVMLNKNFGISVEQGAELNKVFQNIGGLSAAQSQALIGQTTEMAKMAGVAPSKVIADMAESSETAYKYFNGSPKQLAKAAVEAAKLGTSIKQAGEVADNLLDFENSITAELEASAILGTNLNLSQARYLAANGDVLGAQQAVLDQVASLGDLTKLNTFEQKALADATGMQMSDLINQQRIREQFGSLNAEQLKSANSLMAAGRDITSLSKQDLDLQTQRLASQEEMQSVMDKFDNTTAALKTAFSDMFEPVTAFVMPILSDLFTILSAVLLPVFRVIGIVFKAVFKPLKAVYDIISAIVMPLVAIGSAIIDALITPIESALDALDPFFNKIAEFKPVMMKMVSPIISIVGSIGKLFGSLVGGAVGFFVNFLVKGFGMIYDVISSIGEGITTYIVNPIMTAVNAISGAFSSISSFLGISNGAQTDGSVATTGLNGSQSNGSITTTARTGPTDTQSDGSTTPSGHINDGVVQDGKIISTNPADTIFAMKKPQDLANNTSTTIQSSPNIDISALVNKMDEMIRAVSQNRDVYMDREKVSSAVVTTSEKSSQNRFGLMGA